MLDHLTDDERQEVHDTCLATMEVLKTDGWADGGMGMYADSPKCLMGALVAATDRRLLSPIAEFGTTCFSAEGAYTQASRCVTGEAIIDHLRGEFPPLKEEPACNVMWLYNDGSKGYVPADIDKDAVMTMLSTVATKYAPDAMHVEVT